MAKIIELTQYKGKSRKPKKYLIRPKIKIGISALGFFTVIILFFLSIMYLIQANRTATFGIEIKEYDKTIEELKKERRELELKAAKLRSTTNIKENIDNLNMIQVDRKAISYYTIKNNEMANK